MNWDQYFMLLAFTAASRSKCESRQIGAVVVKDRRVLGTGYNGPPAGYQHCDPCPRIAAGYPSGTAMDICPAVHAEVNAIISAGNCQGASIYMSCPLPCKACAGAIVNAGIIGIYLPKNIAYDALGREIIQTCGITVVEVRYAPDDFTADLRAIELRLSQVCD